MKVTSPLAAALITLATSGTVYAKVKYSDCIVTEKKNDLEQRDGLGFVVFATEIGNITDVCDGLWKHLEVFPDCKPLEKNKNCNGGSHEDGPSFMMWDFDAPPECDPESVSAVWTSGTVLVGETPGTVNCTIKN